MTILDVLFIMGFLAMLGIIGTKLYNVLTLGQTYDWKIAVILFVGYFIFWLVDFIVFMIEPTKTIYMLLFNFSTWLIIMNVLFFIIELFLIMKTLVSPIISSYKSIQQK